MTFENVSNPEYSNFIALSRYARWVPEEKRRETWEETVRRYINYFYEKYPEQLENVKDELYNAILNLDVMPSMRALMTAGKALDRDNVASFNCSFLAINRQRAFDEAMYILMCGTGVGFSVERQHIQQLPTVAEEFHETDTTIVVADSKIGWASALRELISLLYAGKIPKWDMSKVRPAGAPLKTFGGRACLTGDTIVYKDRKKSRGYDEITIKQLYEMQERIGKWKHNPTDFNKIKIKSVDEDTGEFFRNKILGVVYNGIAPVYTIITKNGYRIKATLNHRFMNELGNYQLLEDFHIGDMIAVNGNKEKKTGICEDDEIISIEYSGEEDVYDLQMQGPNHNFVANGFISHNSGPDPLDDLFRFCVELFRNAAGRKLTSLECHDIICKIGEIVVVGGVRRSACISLSNLSDERMRKAKMGEWWIENPQRALANNSVCYTEKPDIGMFMKEWLSLYESKSGERGIFNREANKRQAARFGRRDAEQDFGTNPCSEIILRDRQFCNLSEIVVRTGDTFDDLRRKARIAAILGTLQATLTNFRYLSKKWKENTEEEALLGVSLTGIMDHPILSGKDMYGKWFTTDEFCDPIVGEVDLRQILEELRNEVVETNIVWADSLGIKPSAASTCVKPSGTVSQLVDSASGIHPRYSKYYVRTVRADKKDPLSQFMREAGFPVEDDITKPDSTDVFSFPMKAPENSVFRDDMTAIEQLKHWLTYQRHWCVTGDTYITTERGVVAIESVVGESHYVWNGSSFQLCEIYSTGKQNVFRVEFDDGSYIDMTSNHKLVDSTGNKRELSTFSVGDLIDNSFELPVVNQQFDSDPFADAYSQGFYSGDGYTNGDWTLVYKPKYTVLNRLVGEINNKGTSNRGKYWKHKDANVLDKTFVPLNCSVDYKLNWLAGLIDADGNKLGKGFQIASVDHSFIENIKLLLTTLGVKSRIQQKSASSFGINNCYYLNVSGKYTRRLLLLGLKTERVELIGCNSTKDKPLTITAINHIGKYDTFCFTEPEKGLGTFNGIVTGQCEHKPSITVYVREHEWMDVGAWVYEHFDEVSGVSFLPHSNHSYKQAPYQEIDEETYNKLLEEMPKDVDWSRLGEYEKGVDTTAGSKTYACSGDSCEIVDLV